MNTNTDYERHFTDTQASFIALNFYELGIRPIKDICKKFAIRQVDFKRAKDIRKHNPVMANILFNGGAVRVESDRLSKSLTEVYKYLKQVEEAA